MAEVTLTTPKIANKTILHIAHILVQIQAAIKHLNAVHLPSLSEMFTPIILFTTKIHNILCLQNHYSVKYDHYVIYDRFISAHF